MTPSTLDKIARRARKALAHATRQALDATTEKARNRHQRRAATARQALRSLGYDARRSGHGLDEADFRRAT